MEKVKANPDLEMQQSKTVRKEKAEAEEGLLLARRARQEKELQKKEVRVPASGFHCLQCLL